MEELVWHIVNLLQNRVSLLQCQTPTIIGFVSQKQLQCP